jgi:nitrite reductase (NADH) large subunit
MQAQQAVVRGLRLDRRQERRFSSNLPVWVSSSVSLATWPDDAPVCSCTGVTSGTLKRAFAEGHCTLDALVQATGAGSVCGTCRPLVTSLLRPAQAPARPALDRALLYASATAAVALLVWFAAPPIPFASSVQGPGYDGLWRDPTLKQATGFSLAFSLAAGSVFSLRKRIAKFRWGMFSRWRVFHALASMAALTLAAAHTGLRLGSNFNAVLMLVFLATASCGTVAGFAAVFEPSLPPGVGQRLRARANRLHLYLSWPLPLLITFHVLKFYYF